MYINFVNEDDDLQIDRNSARLCENSGQSAQHRALNKLRSQLVMIVAPNDSVTH